jgi:hypothetical protein
MSGLTPEQEAKLNEIDAGEGKNLTPAQKAVVLKFGTIQIKADAPPMGMKKGGYDPDKPLPDATIPDLEKSGGGSVDVDPGPTQMGTKKK